MKKFRVTAQATVEIVTIVEAENEGTAISEAMDRDVDICIHGSEFAEHEANADEFCLVDGCCEYKESFEAEEVCE